MIPLIESKNITKRFDGIYALNNFSLSLNENELLGLIGPNGAGKSTFFNVITGFLKHDSGQIFLGGKSLKEIKSYKAIELGIARTFQNLRLIGELTVIENLLLSFQNQPGENVFNVFLKTKVWQKTEKENVDKAFQLLKQVKLEEKAYFKSGEISYGEQKLVSILCCLASDSKILLLDEPIAGINPAMREKILSLIRTLPELGKSAIIIDHDMDFIFNICNRIVFMDMGENISEGTPDEVKNDPKVIEAYLS